MAGTDEARIVRMTVFPVKSLEGVDVSRATVLPSGALAGDRRWAIIDRDGKLVNAKRTSRIHELAAEFNLAADEIRIGIRGQPCRSFSLTEEAQELSCWLSDFFGHKVHLVENVEVGFPDDRQAPGPTILSSESLVEVAGWFDGLSVAQARRRFRANIELAAEMPFWEDRLYGPADSPVRFRIGEMVFEGSNPCARCVVPTRAPSTGLVWPRFASEFAARRQARLPAWAEASRFDHFYRLSVNTRLAERGIGGVLNLGDWVVILSS